jgi:hypothetical protein
MSNKQLYQKNVFLQKTKDKFNPDVLKAKEDIDKNRKLNVFKKTNVTYNSITNNTPENIKSQKDLELQKDNAILNIETVMAQIKKDREDQEIQFKPIKQKLIMDKTNEQKKNIDFNEMKEEQNEYLNTHKKTVEINKTRYDDILCNLKNLGILNN